MHHRKTLFAIGVVLLLRRTRVAVIATLVAAMTAGLVIGGAVVAAPDLKAPCPEAGTVDTETREGSFSATGAVELDFSCGDLEIDTAPGRAWRLETCRSAAARPSSPRRATGSSSGPRAAPGPSVRARGATPGG